MFTTDSDQDEQYRTTKTELLPDNPMCFECGNTVEEWVVVFEPTAQDDSGYSKLHRCPHCNELCFDDQRANFGCAVMGLIFFLMFCVFWRLMELLTGEIKAGEDGYQGTDALRVMVAMIAAMCVAGWCDKLIASRQKQLLRRKHEKQHAESD